jgi:hypothetical protein
MKLNCELIAKAHSWCSSMHAAQLWAQLLLVAKHACIAIVVMRRAHALLRNTHMPGGVASPALQANVKCLHIFLCRIIRVASIQLVPRASTCCHGACTSCCQSCYRHPCLVMSCTACWHPVCACVPTKQARLHLLPRPAFDQLSWL